MIFVKNFHLFKHGRFLGVSGCILYVIRNIDMGYFRDIGFVSGDRCLHDTNDTKLEIGCLVHDLTPLRIAIGVFNICGLKDNGMWVT